MNKKYKPGGLAAVALFIVLPLISLFINNVQGALLLYVAVASWMICTRLEWLIEAADKHDPPKPPVAKRP